MFDPREKIALFIDGANLYATSRSLGFDIDYRKLLASFQKRGYLLRAYYSTALVEDQEYSSIRPLNLRPTAPSVPASTSSSPNGASVSRSGSMRRCRASCRWRVTRPSAS